MASDELVVGIDEVGRGAWAGPVVAGAVILPPRLKVDGLADSKLLTLSQRLRTNRLIRQRALAIGLGWVAAHEVDAHGLTWAVQQSGLRALASLQLAALGSDPATTLIILDGNHNYLKATHHATAIIKADATIMPVAAASVVAKVARDRYMAVLARRHPDYGFEHHVGYGTAVHRAALDQFGPTPFHRYSYAPLRRLAL
jgi:ribonuclease HII